MITRWILPWLWCPTKLLRKHLPGEDLSSPGHCLFKGIVVFMLRPFTRLIYFIDWGRKHSTVLMTPKGKDRWILLTWKCKRYNENNLLFPDLTQQKFLPTRRNRALKQWNSLELVLFPYIYYCYQKRILIMSIINHKVLAVKFKLWPENLYTGKSLLQQGVKCKTLAMPFKKL